jgi:hypothetical protein
MPGEASDGAALINHQFRTWMSDRFRSCFTKLPDKETGPQSPFMKKFEQCKPELCATWR